MIFFSALHSLMLQEISSTKPYGDCGLVRKKLPSLQTLKQTCCGGACKEPTVKRPGRRKGRDRERQRENGPWFPGYQRGGDNTWEDREVAGWCGIASLLPLCCKVRSQSVQSPGLGFPMKNVATWLAREGWRMRQEFCQNHSSTSQCGMCLPRYRAVLQSTNCPELKSAQLKRVGSLMDETLRQLVFKQLEWKI